MASLSNFKNVKSTGVRVPWDLRSGLLTFEAKLSKALQKSHFGGQNTPTWESIKINDLKCWQDS